MYVSHEVEKKLEYMHRKMQVYREGFINSCSVYIIILQVGWVERVIG